jgi:2,3-bisphosphoglycerate-dependent phosphoglycerate mutase
MTMDTHKYPNLNHIFPSTKGHSERYYQLVLVRHGESLWNLQKRFTGWTDVDLTPEGERQAERAGENLHRAGFDFNIAFTSVLTRAIRTTWLILEKLNLVWIPICKSWRLNERHYGALQGLNKETIAEKYGKQQVFTWRRSYDVRPPALSSPDAIDKLFDERYDNLRKDDLPRAESLKDTYGRLLPYWFNTIVPTLITHKKVLVVAHGNSLRALVKYLDNISDTDIEKLEIPTGQPLIYRFDSSMKPVSHHYLEDGNMSQTKEEKQIEVK